MQLAAGARGGCPASHAPPASKEASGPEAPTAALVPAANVTPMSSFPSKPGGGGSLSDNSSSGGGSGIGGGGDSAAGGGGGDSAGGSGTDAS